MSATRAPSLTIVTHTRRLLLSSGCDDRCRKKGDHVMETISPAPSVVTEVTAEDVFRFSLYHTFHDPGQRWRVWVSYLVAVAGVVWNLAYQVPTSLAVLAGVAMACAAPFLYRSYLRCEANRAVRDSP